MQQPLPYHATFSAIIELQSVDSTNNYALGLINDGLAVHGQAVFAHEQWKGKGQRGKEWHTDTGKNIILSTIVQPAPLQLYSQFALSAAVALGVRQFFEKYAATETFIKWPNDIYCMDRKAGGILIENQISHNKWNWAVIGTGINVNQEAFDDLLSKAISLNQITGEQYDVLALADDLREHILKYIKLLQEKGRPQVIEQYNSFLYKKNTIAKLKKGAASFDARILGVNKLGELVVKRGFEERFGFGEVEWVL